MVIKSYKGTELRRIEFDRNRRPAYTICFVGGENPEAVLERSMPSWNIPEGITAYSLEKLRSAPWKKDDSRVLLFR